MDKAVSSCPGWSNLPDLVAIAAQLTDTFLSEPISHVVQGHNRFRRYIVRMLGLLNISGAKVATPLLGALDLIRQNARHDQPTGFLRRTSKWRRHLKLQDDDDNRLWEVASPIMYLSLPQFWDTASFPASGIFRPSDSMSWIPEEPHRT